MKFYTKFQLPQNLFFNIRNMFSLFMTPADNAKGYIKNKNYDPTFMTIRIIIALLRGTNNLKQQKQEVAVPIELLYLHHKRKTYLWISLLLHTVILLPLTLLIALTGDLIHIALKPVFIALNLALDIAQLALEAVTLALQLVAFTIEKVIVNPIAFVFNKLFSKANNEEEAGNNLKPEEDVLPPVPPQEAPDAPKPAASNPGPEVEEPNNEAPKTWTQSIKKKLGW